jgi:predicted aminopeptidase
LKRFALLIALTLPLLSGCANVAYYWQGIRGELDILERAQPIPAVIETTSDAILKRKLERSIAIRDYASRELALPDNGSYRSYADIGRRFVLWNVIATPELSLEPRQWCFPIAGCVNYRGYFEEASAKSEAVQFAVAGDDVHIGGVPAFSTLGYFNDPILYPFIPTIQSAGSSFTSLRIRSRTQRRQRVFNGSFAVMVEEGRRRT